MQGVTCPHKTDWVYGCRLLTPNSAGPVPRLSRAHSHSEKKGGQKSASEKSVHSSAGITKARKMAKSRVELLILLGEWGAMVQKAERVRIRSALDDARRSSHVFSDYL